MDDCPKFKSMLEAFRCKNVLNDFWNELVFGTTPQCGQAKLSIGIHGRFFEDASSRMEELADAWIVETRLPFLDQGQLETSVVRSFSVYWERRPAIQIVVLFPVAESQLSLDQPIVVELEKFSGATVFAIQSVVHCRPNIEFGLHVHDVGETDVDTLRLEKWFGKKVVSM